MAKIAATGYVHQLLDENLTPKQWATQCLRAFGACVLQRDNPMDEPPKEREVAPYYARAVEEAEAALEAWRNKSQEERLEEVRRTIAAGIACCKKSIDEQSAEYNRLAQVKEVIEAWEPAEEVNGVKRHMLEQLARSEGDLDFQASSLALAESKTPESLLEGRERELVEDLARARKSLAEEEKRCRESNAWLALALAEIEKIPEEALV